MKIRSALLAHVAMSLSAVTVACGSFSADTPVNGGSSGSSGSSDSSGSSGSSSTTGTTGSAAGTTGAATGATGTATGATGAAAGATGTATGTTGTATTGTATGTSGTATGTSGTATGTSGTSGTTTGAAGTSSGTSTVASGPCDILGAAGNPCVAAHSTVRALYGSYTGNLYQVKRTDGTTANIAVVGGFANAAAQDTFCAGSICTITIIYDQSSQKNDLTPGVAGGAKATPDNPASATALKITIGGHEAYGVLISPGIGYRRLKATGTATGDDPETEYMVTSQNNLGPGAGGCCFDYGNAETDAHDDGAGTMEAVYFGQGVVWGTGSPGGHGNGPWVMGDLENGLYAGWQNNQDQNISTNTPLKFNYVTAVVVGDTKTQNNGGGRFALYGADATSGALKVEYDGIRPSKGGYVPMTKQGSIILGIGGDNSDSDAGEWFEGVMTTGAATLATCNAFQANIVTAGYGK